MAALYRLLRGNTQFLMGITIGLAVSFVMTSYREVATISSMQRSQDFKKIMQIPLAAWNPDHNLEKRHLEEDIHAGGPQGVVSGSPVRFDDTPSHDDNDSLALELAKRHRVLCWILTSPSNLDSKAVHVRNTWVKRCNKVLFMSSEWNSSFPTIGLNVSEGRSHLTAKTMLAFRYVFENHVNDADWFLKADDDTYVIMENLRYFLSSYNTEDPIYFGHIFKAIVKGGYPSGGAGYILSKEALKRLGGPQGKNTSLCNTDGGAEDVQIGKCMTNLGVKLLPTVDVLGRSRFHCFGPEAHLQGRFPDWYYKYDAAGARAGVENISDYAITFHYMGGSKMYLMEYFVYHLRPYGIISKIQTLNFNNR